MAAELTQRSIVFVPFPAQGHVTPMLHLARATVDRGHGNISVTVAVPDFIHRRMGGQDSAAGVALVSIPSGVADDGSGEPPGPGSFLHAMEHYMPAQLEGMLTAQRGVGARRVSCLVVDLLASWAIPVAARCSLPVVGFWVGMLATYRTVAVIPELISKGFISESGTLPADGIMKHKNIGDLNVLPAKLKLRFKDLPWLLDSALPQKSRIHFWLQALDRAKSLRSILVNSIPNECGDSSDQQYEQMLQVGPLLFNDDSSEKTTTMWQPDNTCMDWLDRQSPGSVIYVSFGSWAAPIQPDKITGFANGLEASGRPFLWALKNHPSWRAGLPENYVEKVSGRGKIVSWAPQEDVLKHRALGCYIMHCGWNSVLEAVRQGVLKHRALGCYIMHCGWNSVLEAVRQGVRMICYPVCADHFINCAYIVNMWNIGIQLASSDQSDVKDCFERVMEGKEGRLLQQKLNELRETITVGEAMCVAKRNINLFMDRINNDYSQIKA